MFVPKRRGPKISFDTAIDTNQQFHTAVNRAVSRFRRSMKRFERDSNVPFGKYADACRDEFRNALSDVYRAHNIDRSTLVQKAEALLQAVVL